MVLAELGAKINHALRNLNNATVIDAKVLKTLLNEIATALFQADVAIQLVAQMKKNIQRTIDLEELAGGVNKRRLIQKAVFDQLVRRAQCPRTRLFRLAVSHPSRAGSAGLPAPKPEAPPPALGCLCIQVNMLDADRQPYQLKKGKSNVVMFVGLQGSGKTTTIAKYAYHYRKKVPCIKSCRAPRQPRRPSCGSCPPPRPRRHGIFAPTTRTSHSAHRVSRCCRAGRCAWSAQTPSVPALSTSSSRTPRA